MRMREAVGAWAGLRLREPLTGGARNPVMGAERAGQRLVVRRSGRAPASLDWELDLLAHLRQHGVGVPEIVPADDGRRHVDGVMVHRFVEGRPPDGPHDWAATVRAVREVHRVTVGWPQRPGFASAGDLLTSRRGGDVRLDSMPARAVDAARAAWRAVLDAGPDTPDCAIHGDLGAGNVLAGPDGRITLLDWDEARVDQPWFDFAFLPDGVPAPFPGARDVLVTAGVAWEAATCWVPEPEYAARRLAELYARRAEHDAPGTAATG